MRYDKTRRKMNVLYAHIYNMNYNGRLRTCKATTKKLAKLFSPTLSERQVKRYLKLLQDEKLIVMETSSLAKGDRGLYRTRVIKTTAKNPPPLNDEFLKIIKNSDLAERAKATLVDNLYDNTELTVEAPKVNMFVKFNGIIQDLSLIRDFRPDLSDEQIVKGYSRCHVPAYIVGTDADRKIFDKLADSLINPALTTEAKPLYVKEPPKSNEWFNQIFEKAKPKDLTAPTNLEELRKQVEEIEEKDKATSSRSYFDDQREALAERLINNYKVDSVPLTGDNNVEKLTKAVIKHRIKARQDFKMISDLENPETAASNLLERDRADALNAIQNGEKHENEYIMKAKLAGQIDVYVKIFDYYPYLLGTNLEKFVKDQIDSRG